jgi:hypothetical protein
MRDAAAIIEATESACAPGRCMLTSTRTSPGETQAPWGDVDSV